MSHNLLESAQSPLIFGNSELHVDWVHAQQWAPGTHCSGYLLWCWSSVLEVFRFAIGPEVSHQTKH